MATLFISEYTGALIGGGQVAVEPSITDQIVAVSGSSTASAAFSPSTHLVRLLADASCSIAFGSSPTAALTSKLLPANVPEYFAVRPGHKVACITNT